MNPINSKGDIDGVLDHASLLEDTGLADQANTLNSVGHQFNVVDFGAAGDGVTDDTAAIQATLDAASAPGIWNTIITIPPGIYKISSPLIISSTFMILNLTISAFGAELSADATSKDLYDEYMLSIYPTPPTTENSYINIRGLVFRGNYKAKGLKLNYAHHVYLHRLTFWTCRVGFGLSNVYYGEMSGDSTFRYCLTGIETLAKSPTEFGEVNTFDFGNVTIGMDSGEKKQFYPQNEGESLDDWDARVGAINSYGVLLGAISGGVKFNALTLEGMDWGFAGFKRLAQAEQTAGIQGNNFDFSIDKCYFEAIKKGAVALAVLDRDGNFVHNIGTELLIVPMVSISRCRAIDARSGRIMLGYGTFYVTQNDIDMRLELISENRTRQVVVTDIEPQYIKENPATMNRMLTSTETRTADSNPYKYRPWGDQRNNYPDVGMMGTLSDTRGAVIQTPFSNNPVLARNIYSVTAAPVTYDSMPDSPAGPVLKDETGGYHMIGMKNGRLKTTKVLNLLRIASPPAFKTAKELYRNRNILPGETVFCPDFGGQGSSLTKGADGKWWHTGYEGTRLAIGTTGELIQAAGAAETGWACWNVSINRSWYKRSGYWSPYMDWYGFILKSKQGTDITGRAHGTLGQRDSISANELVDGYVYYAEEKDIHYIYKKSTGSWKAYVCAWENMRVISVSPAKGSTGINANASVTIGFTNRFAGVSEYANTVRLLNARGNPVAGHFWGGGTMLNFTPDAPLTPGATYRVNVAAGTIDNGVGEEQTRTLFAFTSTFTVARRN